MAADPPFLQGFTRGKQHRPKAELFSDDEDYRRNVIGRLDNSLFTAHSSQHQEPAGGQTTSEEPERQALVLSYRGDFAAVPADNLLIGQAVYIGELLVGDAIFIFTQAVGGKGFPAASRRVGGGFFIFLHWGPIDAERGNGGPVGYRRVPAGAGG